jgi:hypothetical protein
VYRWELDDSAQPAFDGLGAAAQALLTSFTDAVVIVDPMEYQRHPGERSDPLASIAFAILAGPAAPPGAFMNVALVHTGVMQTHIHRRRGAGTVHQQPLWSPAPHQRDHDQERRGQQDS